MSTGKKRIASAVTGGWRGGLAAMVVGAALLVNPVLAQKSDITIGMQLEPPNLDPTGGGGCGNR